MSKSQPYNVIPQHIAIVMDGNGRWANKRFLPRVAGHKQGIHALIKMVEACAARQVDYLTVFAFSSENWKRPEDEVSGLMGLMISTIARYLTQLSDQGVKIKIIGDRSQISSRVQQAWDEAERATQHNKRLTLSVAFNYGGRWDIVQACQRALAAGVTGDQLSEECLASYMALAYAPDPDLLIRTGGEYRLSNFLLWQTAYSELYFTDCLWPAFDEHELDLALNEFAKRERRFGGIRAAHLAA